MLIWKNNASGTGAVFVMPYFPGIYHWKRVDVFTSRLVLFLLGVLRHVAS